MARCEMLAAQCRSVSHESLQQGILQEFVLFPQRTREYSCGGFRAADYCYPNILACVQPDVLRKIADKSDLENGFLGRFLFARMVHVLCQPNSFDLQKTLDEMSLLLEAFKRKEG